MRKIWIVGAYGHIGRALSVLINKTEYEIFETDKDDVDITNMSQVTTYMNMNRPDVVINCAGYNARVNMLNFDNDMAYKVNAVGARNLAQAAESIHATLIHLSTDDVFSKPSDSPYNEFDDVCPATIYGKSKYAGECLIERLMTRYVIIRSSWIYGIGHDFVNDILDAAHSPIIDTLVLDNNDVAVPTSADELAKLIMKFIDTDNFGVFHAVCSGGSCTRLEYAEKILEYAGLKDKLNVILSDSAENNSKYSVLDNMMIRITGMEELAPWDDSLKSYIKEIGGIN